MGVILGGLGSGSSGGDMARIAEVLVGVGGQASISFSSISSAYRHLEVFWAGRCDNAAPQTLQVQFNGDGGANYDREYTQYNDGIATFSGAVAQVSISIGRVPGTGAPAGAMASGKMEIPYYATATQDKVILNNQFGADGAAAGDMFLNTPGGAWRTSNAPITSILFTLSLGNFIQNSIFSLYGIL